MRRVGLVWVCMLATIALSAVAARAAVMVPERGVCTAAKGVGEYLVVLC